MDAIDYTEAGGQLLVLGAWGALFAGAAAAMGWWWGVFADCATAARGER